MVVTSGRCRHSVVSLDTRPLVPRHIRLTNIYFKNRTSSYPLNNSCTSNSSFPRRAPLLFPSFLPPSRSLPRRLPPPLPPDAALRFFLTVFEAIVLTPDPLGNPNRISCEMLRKIEAQEEAERCRSVLLRLGTAAERGSARFDTGVFPSNLPNRRRVVAQ